ncbi:MAG: hypothetical protein HY247_00875 [archaeon]|nr:MAG: hypothetical protein HY247_00875 [archaeon]
MSLAYALGFVFVAAFLANVSPFFGASYTLLAALQLGYVGYTPANFAAIVFASALGATLAKVVIYYGAFGLKKQLKRNKNIQLIGRNASTGKFYAVLFGTALLPILPLDDFIFIGAGATGASIAIMSAVTMAAKVVKSAVEVALEFAILRDVGDAFGFNSIEATVALSAVFLLIGIAIYKLDWGKTFAWLKGSRSRSNAGVQGKRL